MKRALLPSPLVQTTALACALCAAACGATDDVGQVATEGAESLAAGAGGAESMLPGPGALSGAAGSEPESVRAGAAGEGVMEAGGAGADGSAEAPAVGAAGSLVEGRGGATPSSGGGGLVVSDAPGASSGAGAGPLQDPASAGSGGVPPEEAETEQSGAGGAASNEAGGAGDCPHSGAITYTLNQPETWPADVVERLTAAMDEAVYYYNCYADLEHSLTVNFNEGVPTAEANVDGWMSFGADRGYMVVATAMHEVAHTLGVGFAPWTELLEGGRFTGANVNEFMQQLPQEERDPDAYSQRDYITGDGQHFWPYGLNQASEHQSEWSLINNVRIVAAINADKAAYRAR